MSERDMRVLVGSWTSDMDSEVASRMRWERTALEMQRVAARDGYAIIIPSVVVRTLPGEPHYHQVRAFSVPMP